MEHSCRRLLLRADATPEIGTGHVMRCLALAQSWQDTGGEVLLATAMSPAGIENRLAAEGVPIHLLCAEAGSDVDARETSALALETRAVVVVVDGYHFSGRYQNLLKEVGVRLLVLDDNGHADHYSADAVLNQNLHASETLYSRREPKTRLLLGPGYALLRREFGKWRGWKRTHPVVAKRVLLTFGGSDPVGATMKAVAAVRRLEVPDLEVRVVGGAANANLAALRHEVSTTSGSASLLTDVHDMAEQMAWADLAVTAGGSTSWELAFMGLPALTVVLAENQVNPAEALAFRGVTRNLGWHANVGDEELTRALADLISDQSARRDMGARGQALVDGDGGRRVVQALFEAAA